jgi:hypothetical protein
MHSASFGLAATHGGRVIVTRSLAIAVAVFLIVVLVLIVGFVRSLAGRSGRRQVGADLDMASGPRVIARFPRRPVVADDITTTIAAVGKPNPVVAPSGPDMAGSATNNWERSLVSEHETRE